MDVDALLARPLEHKWGSAQAAVALAPLAKLPPADVGIVAAIGDASLHEGRKWHLCGAIGGIMRKAGYPPARCEAVIREWLTPLAGPSCDVNAGVKHALGAYAKGPHEVSGFDSLAEIVGADHAGVIETAIVSARRPRVVAANGNATSSAADPFRPAAPYADSADTLALDMTRQGTPRPSQLNVGRCLEHWFGDRVRFDEARGRIVVFGVDETLGRFPDGIWEEAHTYALVELCEKHQLNVGPEVVTRAVELHARHHGFNPIEEDFVRLARAWDGVARVDQAFTTYWRCEDTPAHRAAARVWLLSVSARALSPGEKVDTVPVFFGPQGRFKSTALSIVAGGPDRFGESPLPIGDKDAMQIIRGKLIWELGENASVSKKDRNTLKAFFSQRVDTFRASYGRHTVDVPRTCTFAISTNDEEFLNDPTGNRRYLPVRMTDEAVNLELLRRDRDQLIGEAATRVLADEQWWPTDEEESALEAARDAHVERDPWQELIAEWLDRRGDKPFTMRDVFSPLNGAVPTQEAQWTRATQARGAACLRALGYERRREWRHHSWKSGQERGKHFWAKKR